MKKFKSLWLALVLIFCLPLVVWGAFPSTLTNAVDGVTEIFASHLNNMEDKIGIDSSSVTSSLDYMLRHSGSIDPGHKHTPPYGGTGIYTYAIGDLLYASSTSALSRLADVATGNALISGGVGAAPAWGKVALTTHISGVLPVANGGTNIATYAIGDLLYASTAGILSKLPDVATGNALISGGVGVAPAYGKVGLTTHVSGVLPVANGGTGLAAPLYGEMYHYENTDLTLIDVGSEYHAIIVKTTGLVSGFTYKIGTTALITQFATHSLGAATLVTSAGHLLVSGEYVTISGCAKAEYNATHLITWIDVDTFTIPVSYGAEAIGGAERWTRGSSLRANTGSAGIYRVAWNATCTPVGANNFFKIESKQNNVDLDNMAASAVMPSAAGYYNLSASGLVTIADGDYIWLQIKNQTDGTDIRVRHINLNLVRLAP